MMVGERPNTTFCKPAMYAGICPRQVRPYPTATFMFHTRVDLCFALSSTEEQKNAAIFQHWCCDDSASDPNPDPDPDAVRDYQSITFRMIPNPMATCTPALLSYVALAVCDVLIVSYVAMMRERIEVVCIWRLWPYAEALQDEMGACPLGSVFVFFNLRTLQHKNSYLRPISAILSLLTERRWT